MNHSEEASLQDTAPVPSIHWPGTAVILPGRVSYGVGWVPPSATAARGNTRLRQ